MTDPKALREMCEAELAKHQPCDGCDNATIARALLDRLSGEAVTLEWLTEKITPHLYRWDTDENYTSGDVAKFILSLLPAGMDRNAIIEECAAVVDRGWVAADNLPMYLGAVSKAIRELKS